MSAKLVMFTVVVAAAVAFAAKTPDGCVGGCEAVPEEKKADCQRGQRYYRYSEANGGRLSQSVLDRCKEDCGDSYLVDAAAVDACRKGCLHASHSPLATTDNDVGSDYTISLGSLPGFFDLSGLLGDMRNPGDRFKNIFGDKAIAMAEGPQEEKGKKGPESLFAQVHSMMRSMMSGPMFGGSLAKEGDLVGMPLEHSGGELVVIRSGPGFHEEKTYQLGPNSDIDKIVESGMQDMMDHKNPIEKFGELNDIEVFNPADLSSGKLELRDDNSVVGANQLFRFDTDPWGFIRDGGVLDEPMLPETGLKSQRVVEERSEDNPNAERTWSGWLTCLRARMGLPNWLMAASVALGVIFSIWLCMVIPSSAPKQKVRKGKMMIGTKEAEAEMGIATVMAGRGIRGKVDLPPSYDDVAKGGDPEPVHLLKAKVDLDDGDDGSKMAGPLPEKKDLA